LDETLRVCRNRVVARCGSLPGPRAGRNLLVRSFAADLGGSLLADGGAQQFLRCNFAGQRRRAGVDDLHGDAA
jgi:hypothetical protein